jgi:hypothetical protein
VGIQVWEFCVDSFGYLQCIKANSAWAQALIRPLTDNQPHHVAWTVASGGATTLYVDMEVVGSGSMAGLIATPLTVVSASVLGDINSKDYLDGFAADVVWWPSSAPTTAQLQSIYTAWRRP